MPVSDFIKKTNTVNPSQFASKQATRPVSFFASQSPEKKLLGGTSAEIRQAPIGRFEGLFDKAISALPDFIEEPARDIGQDIREGLFGRGQVPDIEGKTKFDTGLVGFFRPFGIGKPAEQKALDRSNLLKPLVEQGKISEERADEIAKSVIPRGLLGQVEDVDLTKEEKLALRPVRIEETLDKVFGALDIVSLGTIKPIAKSAAQKIAKSNVVDEIIEILSKEIPDLADDAKTAFARALRDIDNADDVQKVLNRTELALQEARKAQPKRSLQEIFTDTSVGRPRATPRQIERPTVAPETRPTQIQPPQKRTPTQTRLEQDISPLSPRITQTRRESTLLKERLRREQTASRRGLRQGTKQERSAQRAIREREIEDLRRKGEISSLKQRIKDRFTFVERGLRQGTIKTKQEIKNVQQEVEDLVKAFLPVEEQGKFLTTLRNIQTPEQLQRKMPNLQERISNILDRRESKDIRNQIAKELKSPKVRLDRSGVKIGQVEPNAQRKLDSIKETLRLSEEKAFEKLEDITAKFEDIPEIPEAVADEIRLLRYKAGLENPQVARQILDDIRSIKETGRTIRELQVQNQRAEVERIQDAFVNSITGGRGITSRTSPSDLPSARTDFVNRLLKATNSAEDNALMVTFLMDKLARADNTTQYMQSPMNRWWSQVFENRNIQDRIMNSSHDDVNQALERIFGVKPKTKEHRKLLASWLDETQDLGTFNNAFGEADKIKMTHSQLMYHWGQLQNPNVLPTYRETMGWTDEMIKAVDKSLSDQQKDFVRYVAEGDDSFFGRFRAGEIDDISLDAIYERQFGTPLGKVEGFYIPLSREVDAPMNVQILKDSFLNISTKPSAIKARQANKNPINMSTGLIETLEKHIVEMAHYKAFSDFINQGRKVFTGEVRTAIKQNFRDSNDIVKIVDNIFDDLAKDGVAHARNIQSLNNLRGNTAVAFIGANPVSAMKQYVSVIAWAGEMPTQPFVKGMANFGTNPIEKTRFLVEESQTLKSRFNLGAMERDIQQGMQRGDLNRLSKANSAREVFTILTRVNDRIAVVGGGWGKYIYELERITGQKVPTNIPKLKEFIKKNPEAHKEAINLFEETTLRTQQAGNIENQAQLQRLGSIGDLFTLFQSAPVAQFGNVLSTLRALGVFGDPRRIPTGLGLKRLFIYLVAIPSLLQFIADGFEVKPRRQAAAVGASVGTLGFSNYPLFLGELSINTSRAIAGLPAFDIGTPAPATVLNELKTGVEQNRELIEGEITMEEILNTIKDLGTVIGTMKGIPVEPATRIGGGIFDVATGEGDIRRGIGFSEFALGEQGLEAQDRARKEKEKLLEMNPVERDLRLLEIKTEDEKLLNSIRTNIKNEYVITGNVTSDETVSQIKNIPLQERGLLIGTYTERTQEIIEDKIDTAPNTGRSLDEIFGGQKPSRSLEEIFK